MQLEIINTRSGAVLNRHDGIETSDALIFTLRGIADTQATVLVNGNKAERDDTLFSCNVSLAQKFNRVKITSSSQYGDASLEVVLVWDKNSFKR